MKNNFILMILLLLALASGLSGQTYQTFSSEMNQIIEMAKWRLGPFRIYPRIQFRNIGYDDNVYYQREEEEPISDYTVTVAPEIRAYLLFRNYLILYFTEMPRYVHYFKQKRERKFNNTFYPSFKLLFLSRFVISGRYSWSNNRWRASSEFDTRATEKTRNYQIGIFYETARDTTFGFSRSVRTIRYEDITMPGQEIKLSRALNRDERGSDFQFYYKIFSESTFFIRGGYTEYKFEHIQAGWRDSHSYQLYSGIRFPLFGRVRGTLSLGYKKFITEIEEKNGYSGFVGNSSLDFRLARFGFRLIYYKDVHFSYYSDNVFFNEDRYGIGISFYLTKFLRVDYNLNYAEARYPEQMVIRMPNGSYMEIRRRDIYHTNSFGFVFRIIRNTGIGLMVNIWERTSNIQGIGRNRMFVGGYVTYDF